MLVFPWNAMILCFGDMNVSVFLHKTAHAASDDFSLHFFMRESSSCHKINSKVCIKMQDFSTESTNFTLMSGDVSAIEIITFICNFYNVTFI